MKWILSQDKMTLLNPDSGVVIKVYEFERTGSPTSHGSSYVLSAESLDAPHQERHSVTLGTYPTKQEAHRQLERIVASIGGTIEML